MTQQVLSRPFRYVSVALCLAIVLMFMPHPRHVAAAEEPSFLLTTAFVNCETSTITLFWSSEGSFSQFTATLVDNDTGSEFQLNALNMSYPPQSDGWGFLADLPHLHELDMDVTMSDGSTYYYAIDTNGCGERGYTGGQVTGPITPPVTPTETLPPVTPTETLPPVTPTETLPPVTPTETVPPVTPTETLPPVTPTETLPPETPTVQPTETVVPSPTPGDEDHATPAPQPTDSVIVPSPPSDTSTPVTQPTNPPVTQVAEPPTPQPLSIVFQVPEPTGMQWNVPEASASSKPGDRVRVNIAASGEPEDWVIITIPDPKDGLPAFNATREVQAFYKWLKMAPTVGGLYFTELPTIQIVPRPPVLIEQKEPKKKSCNRSLGALFSGCGDTEDNGEWVGIAQKATVIAAVATVGAVTGGFLVAAYGPWNAVPAGTIFLAAASQDGIGAQPIFYFFVAPEQESWALPELPVGTYMMKLETLDGQVFQMPFTITDDPDQSLSMQQKDDGSWEIVTEHNGSQAERVNALPNTGAGNAFALPITILGLAVIGLGLMALGIRLVPTPSRKR